MPLIDIMDPPDPPPPLVPSSALASAWIPFVVVLLLSLLFSLLYVLWFRSTRPQDRSRPTTSVVVSALAVTLMASALVPADVFLVSFMKFSNGTYKSWAEDEAARRGIGATVMDAYYAFYGIILTFAFLILPLVFFFHVGSSSSSSSSEEDLEPEPFGKKLCRALKYTTFCVVLFCILILIGIFVPFGDSSGRNGTSIFYEARFRLEEQHGENLMVFLLNVLNVIGMVLMIFYTGFGMSSLPVGMIKGQRSIHSERQSVLGEISELEEQIKTIEERRREEGEGSRFEAGQLERLEQQLRLLKRAHRDLDQTARSVVNRMVLCCRPFQVLFGVLFALFGLLIFISLLLTSIDKAMHSEGATGGYVLRNGSSLPNPIDIILVHAQDVFPLDYILYSLMILYFIFCSMSGIKSVGIRFLWLSVYKIRSGRTKPQALVLMCLNLIFIILALNVLMFSIVPDYTTYGSQHFRANVTVGNVTTEVVEKCDDLVQSMTEIPECNMSRVAYLLLSFHSKAWIFGVIYYWFVWAFLVVVLVGSGVSVYRARRYQRLFDEEEDDEEDLLDDSNPFNSSRAVGGRGGGGEAAAPPARA